MHIRSGLVSLRGLIVALALLTLLVGTLLAGAASAAVTLTVTGEIIDGANAGSTDLTLAANGDTVMFNISVANVGNEVVGLTTSVSSADFLLGDANAGLIFDGGKTADTWFNSTTGKFGDPQGGLQNLKGLDGGGDGTYTSYKLPRVLSTADTIGGALQFFSSVALTAATGDGQLDYGILDGATGKGGSPDVGFVSAGAVHAQLFFVVANGSSTIDFAMGPNDGLVVANGDGILTGTSIQVPEPGSMTLGLSAMASVFAIVGLRRRGEQ